MAKKNKSKQSRYQIKALSDGQPVLWIYGDIGEDYWAEESNDAKNIVGKIEAIVATEIHVRLFSYGGNVADALAINNALLRHPAKIITYNDGICYSSMSAIFMSGDERKQAANALLMIHAPMGGSAYLNANEHRDTAEMLDKYAEAMASPYLRSGKSTEEIEALLKDGADHYYTAEQALSEGFATEITESVQIAASGLPDRYSPPAAWVAAIHPKEDTVMTKKQQAATTQQSVVDNQTSTSVQATASTQESTQTVQAVAPVADNTQAVLAAEKQRRTEIRAAATPFKDKEGVQALLDTMLDDSSITVAVANQKILAHLGAQSTPLAGNHSITYGETGGEKFVKGATQAIMARAGLEKREAGNEFRGASMMDMARASLDIAGVNHRGMDKRDVVGSAFTLSNSDFPILMENIMHKTVLTAYAKAADTYSRFCKIGDLSDFRDHSRLRLSSFGNLDSKTENNEFVHKNLADATRETLALGTKGNIIGINREMIINDDVGAFIDLLTQMGRAGKRTLESDVYAYLLSNPVMSDGIQLFHADHKNLAASGAAPNMETLKAAATAMASQTDASGEDFLDIKPDIFLGNLATAPDADTVNESQYDPDTNSKLQRPNKARGLFSEVVASPRVPDGQWYEFADPADAPVIEVGFLDGNQEPYLEMKEGFSQDGALYKVRFDYGIGAIGWEGAYKNPGV